jgi:hypothetical protein
MHIKPCKSQYSTGSDSSKGRLNKNVRYDKK